MKVTDILHKINYVRLKILLLFEPETFVQLHAWVELNDHTDLSYVENMLEWRIPYGIKWRNSL